MAYSSDFRQQVVAACDRGMKTQQVAALFDGAPSWVRRLKQWRRERGSIEPRPCGGSKPKLGPADEAAIHAHFASCPDTTIVELRAAWGTDVSEITVWRKARALGYRFKKSRPTPPSSTGRMSSSAGNSGSRRPSRSTRRG